MRRRSAGCPLPTIIMVDLLKQLVGKEVRNIVKLIEGESLNEESNCGFQYLVQEPKEQKTQLLQSLNCIFGQIFYNKLLSLGLLFPQRSSCTLKAHILICTKISLLTPILNLVRSKDT
jgi:hypothetical protein